MNLKFKTHPCKKGEILPLAPGSIKCDIPCHISLSPYLPSLKTGLYLANEEKIFQICGSIWYPAAFSGPDLLAPPTLHMPLLMALEDISDHETELEVIRENWSCAVITLSDKGAKNERNDISGPLILKMISETIVLSHTQRFVIPDEKCELFSLLAKLAKDEHYDIIVTTGGTGVGPRDITPQITEAMLDIHLPGFVQAMMAKSLEKTPYAVISRAAAGLIDTSLVINLPGSAKAVAENLSAILPALAHALEKINGDQTDCGT